MSFAPFEPMMRRESHRLRRSCSFNYSPFRRQPPPARPLEALMFVMARVHGDETDSMRDRCGPAHMGGRLSTR